MRCVLKKFIPGFPGRLLFFLTGGGGCEIVLEALVLFVVVVVEVRECGLWNWGSISGWCLTAAASSLVFSVEKLPLSQLVMFDIEVRQRKGKKNLLKIFPYLIYKQVLFVSFTQLNLLQQDEFCWEKLRKKERKLRQKRWDLCN